MLRRRVLFAMSSPVPVRSGKGFFQRLGESLQVMDYRAETVLGAKGESLPERGGNVKEYGGATQ